MNLIIKNYIRQNLLKEKKISRIWITYKIKWKLMISISIIKQKKIRKKITKTIKLVNLIIQ